MRKIQLLMVLVMLTIELISQNESKLVIDASSNQTNGNPLIRLRNSSASDLMWIHSDSYFNTFIGFLAGVANEPSDDFDGLSNTFLGAAAGRYNSFGFENTAVGTGAAFETTTGDENTSMGSIALRANTSGSFNTAIGNQALLSTGNSNFNTALGYQAGADYNNGSNNTFLGARTGVNAASLFNIVAIGEGTTVTASNTARLGNSSTTSCGGWANWTNVSDGRFKKNIHADVPGLAFILRLQPVTYNLDVTGLSLALHENKGNEWDDQMKTAIADKEKQVQTGFIAQDVEKAAIAVGYEFSGVDAPKNVTDLYGLRYAEFVVPLVKAVQELNEALRSENEMLTQRLEVLESLLGVNYKQFNPADSPESPLQ